MEYLDCVLNEGLKLWVLNLRYVANASILTITIEEPAINCWC